MNEVIRRRGKGKKRALVHIALRIPPEVYDFYRIANPVYTKLMREVLTEYAERHKPDNNYQPNN